MHILYICLDVLQLVPFVIFPSSSSQGQDHLDHQGQVEDCEQPVESILFHEHHSPHSNERDEDKNKPGQHSTNELEEHDGSLAEGGGGFRAMLWRSSGSLCFGAEESHCISREKSERVQCHKRGKGGRGTPLRTSVSALPLPFPKIYVKC